MFIQILWILRSGLNPQGWESSTEGNQFEKKWVASRAGTRPTRSHIYASKRGAWPRSLNLSKCLSARFARFHLEVAASPSVYRRPAISNPANPRKANDRWTTGDRDKTACHNENTRPIIASATANLTIRLYPPFHQECLVSLRSRAPDSKLTIVLPSIKYSIRNFTKLIREWWI